VFLFISCFGNKNTSPSETVKIVLESLFKRDNSTLKKYTTVDGYDSLLMIQNMLPEESNNTKAKILKESIDGEIAWVKYNTLFDQKPGVFKLVKENNRWKVTYNGPKERGPF
jgi:hypothetical protein